MTPQQLLDTAVVAYDSVVDYLNQQNVGSFKHFGLQLVIAAQGGQASRQPEIDALKDTLSKVMADLAVLEAADAAEDVARAKLRTDLGA